MALERWARKRRASAKASGVGRLRVPDNLTLLPLPLYSPELKPVENAWQLLRQNQLSNRVFDSYGAIVDACCSA